jgi:hypothetical protein
MRRVLKCGPVVLVCLVISQPAAAQRPGHLGKPPPPKVRLQQQRARTVPKWPRRADPKPLKTIDYLDLRLSLAKGRVTVDKLTKGRFAKPTRLRRFRGRFEIHLFTAGLLRDVVRFNFPLTAAVGEPPVPSSNRLGLGLGLSKGVNRARTKVRIPFDARINRLVIVDTLNKKKFKVDLSPVLPKPLKHSPRGGLRTGAFGLAPSTNQPAPKEKKKKATKGKGLKDAKILQRAK